MISVEIGMLEDRKRSDVVEIYFDVDGLNYLLDRISHIQGRKTDHVDLMSRSWGLGDLSEQTHRDDNQIAHHLKLTLVEG
jgi:hypothetical protein